MPVTSRLGFRTEFPWSRYAELGRRTRRRRAARASAAAAARPFLARPLPQARRQLDLGRNDRSPWRPSMSALHRGAERRSAGTTIAIITTAGSTRACTSLSASDLRLSPMRSCRSRSGGRRPARPGCVAMTTPPGRPFLLRAEGLRPRQRRDATNIRKRSRSATTSRARWVLMAIWALSPALAAVRPDPVRPVRAARRLRRLHARNVGWLWLGARRRRPRSSAPSSSSSSATCRPGWSGRRRSSPTRSTTSASTQGAAEAAARRADRSALRTEYEPVEAHATRSG